MKPEITKTTDVNTGEKVSKCQISDDYRSEMEKVLAAHNEKLNIFMMMSQQVADLEIKWHDMRKEITKTDVRFKDKMRYIAKKLKLNENEPWTYNMQDKCFEMREPPDIKPMTANEIESGLAEAPIGT